MGAPLRPACTYLHMCSAQARLGDGAILSLPFSCRLVKGQRVFRNSRFRHLLGLRRLWVCAHRRVPTATESGDIDAKWAVRILLQPQKPGLRNALKSLA